MQSLLAPHLWPSGQRVLSGVGQGLSCASLGVQQRRAHTHQRRAVLLNVTADQALPSVCLG